MRYFFCSYFLVEVKEKKMIEKLKISGSRFSGENLAEDEKPFAKEKNKIIYSYLQLFRFASKLDWILMVFGFLAAIGRGPSFFLLCYFFIGVADVFIAESNSNEVAEWNERPLNYTESCNATINRPTMYP